MAKFDLIESYDYDEYVVRRDDGSSYKRFSNYSEAEAYFHYLQQLDDQRTTIKQNEQIIENQKRLIKIQESKDRVPSRPLFPQPIKQGLDPEYAEWLQFKKETDPAYIKWKKEKDAKEAKGRAERAQRDAELARIREEREEKERESHYKSRISYCKGVADKHQLIIKTYDTWYPIIKRLVQEGAGVAEVDFHNGGGQEYTVMPVFLDHFLKFKGYNYNSWIGACQNITSIYNDDNLSSYSKCSSMESELSNLIHYHKTLQRAIKYEIYKYDRWSCRNKRIQEGVARYLEIVVGNLKAAKEWRQWGWFSDLRKEYRGYWDKYKHLYKMLEPHLKSWQKDMDMLFYRKYDDDE